MFCESKFFGLFFGVLDRGDLFNVLGLDKYIVFRKKRRGLVFKLWIGNWVGISGLELEFFR